MGPNVSNHPDCLGGRRVEGLEMQFSPPPAIYSILRFFSCHILFKEFVHSFSDGEEASSTASFCALLQETAPFVTESPSPCWPLPLMRRHDSTQFCHQFECLYSGRQDDILLRGVCVWDIVNSRPNSKQLDRGSQPAGICRSTTLGSF